MFSSIINVWFLKIKFTYLLFVSVRVRRQLWKVDSLLYHVDFRNGTKWSGLWQAPLWAGLPCWHLTVLYYILFICWGARWSEFFSCTGFCELNSGCQALQQVPHLLSRLTGPRFCCCCFLFQIRSLICILGWSLTQSSCFSFQSFLLTGMCHPTQLNLC